MRAAFQLGTLLLVSLPASLVALAAREGLSPWGILAGVSAALVAVYLGRVLGAELHDGHELAGREIANADRLRYYRGKLDSAESDKEEAERARVKLHAIEVKVRRARELRDSGHDYEADRELARLLGEIAPPAPKRLRLVPHG